MKDTRKSSLRPHHRNSGTLRGHHEHVLREYMRESFAFPLRWWPNIDNRRGGGVDEFGWTETIGLNGEFVFGDG